MIQASKIIGTGLATTGLIGAGAGIGVVFGALILGLTCTGAAGLFALIDNLLAFVYFLLFLNCGEQAVYLLFPVCILSNQSNLVSLNPYFVTGFSDGEACFFIGFNASKKYQTGYQVQAIFQISLYNQDSALLSQIQSYFGAGKISKHGKNSVYLRVTSSKDLRVVISDFDKYPLSSQKRADYELFKQALELIQNKKHLTADGLKEIVSIKASMNLGLSESLKTAFPNVIPVSRPIAKGQKIQEPN
jgi:hypothetical protein